jgi:hypothetical protein
MIHLKPVNNDGITVYVPKETILKEVVTKNWVNVAIFWDIAPCSSYVKRYMDYHCENLKSYKTE